MNGRVSRMRDLVVRHGGTAVVFAALAGVAWWGHQTGWRAPRLAELRGGGDPVEREDWCEAHGVPLSRCIACNPALAGEDPEDWCKEHGMPESQDPLCHPEILTRGQAADWCRDHGVPESQCTICHPEIAVKGEAPPTKSGATVELEAGAALAKDPSACRTHLIRVQFAAAEAVRKAGVELEAVLERPMAAYLSAAGEIDYDQTRVARLSSKAAGAVWRVEKAVGQAVAAGEVLALVDAADVGRAKSEFLQALAQVDVKSKVLDRIRTSAEEGYRTQAEFQEAEAALREARIRLMSAQQALLNLGLPVRMEGFASLPEETLAERMRLLGLSEGIVTTLDPAVTTANLIPVAAPFDGVVVSREVVAGELVDPSKTIFVVADVRRMWVMLEVRQEDAVSLASGQAVIFRPDGSRDSAVRGAISWISTAVDERTRTVRVRADVENPEGGLRAHTFGTGRIVIRESPSSVAVPTEAIHWEGCCHVVFVRLRDEIFQTRKVRLGAASGPYTEVLVGLVPGEVVATRGSHVLKAELLKSKLGAGCVDD